MTNKELAIELKGKGFNCAQAVMMAYAERVGTEEPLMQIVGYGLGGGMGTGDGTCGAVVGACAVYGIAVNNKSMAMKGSSYIMNGFASRNGATQCRQLKGIDTGKPLRSCPGCVADASDLLEDLLGHR
jgi:C_GCAxxG_C_C family probable redox protein